MSEIKTWLDNALLQTAAESYLHELNLDVPLITDIKRQLQAGANDFFKNPGALADPNTAVKTRFTQQQADWFTDNYEIIDHLANTDSGFSATLFRKIKVVNSPYPLEAPNHALGRLTMPIIPA